MKTDKIDSASLSVLIIEDSQGLKQWHNQQVVMLNKSSVPAVPFLISKV